MIVLIVFESFSVIPFVSPFSNTVHSYIEDMQYVWMNF